MTLTLAIGKTVHRLRTENNMSMRMLSGVVSHGHLSTIERGLKETSNSMVESLAKGFGMTTASFLKEVITELEEHSDGDLY